jgi:hypothetical protein
MPHHTYGSLSFQPPPAWRDRTLVTFVAPEAAGPGRPNIVVTGDARLPGETLHALVHRRTNEEAKLPGFTVIEVRQTEVGGRAAVRTRFHARRGALVIDCIVVYVDPPSGSDVITITCSCAAGPARGWITVLDAMLASVTFDASAAAGDSDSEPVPDTLPVRLSPTPPPPRIGAPPLPPSIIPMPGMRARL